jgi:hypothetical protein
MTVDKWMSKVKKEQNLLFNIISEYHPYYNQKHDMKITAPNAENACSVVREMIAKSYSLSASDPQEKFQRALNIDDWKEIYRILDEVWYYVPESTDCWSIPGYKELVNLIDDPPETED